MGTKVPMLCIGHPENTREPAMQNVRQLSFPMIPFVKPYSMK
jgi:hypothetical protein